MFKEFKALKNKPLEKIIIIGNPNFHLGNKILPDSSGKFFKPECLNFILL